MGLFARKPHIAAMLPADNVLEMIGNTPMVRIKHLDTGLCELYVKLESQNPGGSIKDRIARSMIAAAERSGALKPGGTIVEATAGNTGLGLALIAVLKGYKMILVVPDKMSREKIQHCKALGTDVRVTRTDVNKGHPDYYQDMAQRIAQETGGHYIDQFANTANPQAHFETTGPEIWEQMGGRIDAVVAGVGSGGTITGVGRYLKSKNSKAEMVLADPNGSILAPLVETGRTIEPGSWLVEGIGEDFVPPILDLSLVKKAYSISDAESFSTARDMLLHEGIFAGSSSGTLMAAALKYCREQKTHKRVVTFVCDRGDKYLSKSFSDPWITEQGFHKKEATGTVVDLLARRHDQGEVIFVRPEDTAQTVYKRMRVADVSQLPVIEGADTVVGVIDEETLLASLSQDPSFGKHAGSVMRKDFASVQMNATITDARALLQSSHALIVLEDNRFRGILTKVDLLNHLFQQGKNNG